MSNTIWNDAVDGDWTNAADWSAGVPTGKSDAIINANGAYTVTISSADKAHSLTLDAAGATLLENSGDSLTMGGGLTLDAGTVILDGANKIHGGTRLVAGTLELGNAKALGSSSLTISGGTLIGTMNGGFSNAVDASGTFTLAAAHDDTFKLKGQTVLDMNGGGDVVFGQSGADGTFVWAPSTFGLSNGGSGFSVDVNAGTLRDGNGSLNEILSAASTLNIATGADLDIRGYSDTISNLNGSGTILSTVSGGALSIGGGDFSGHMDGSFSVTVDGFLTLRGFNGYTGGTTIDHGATLALLSGASLAGSIVNNGGIDISGAGSSVFTLGNAISGAGSVSIEGGGGVLPNGTAIVTGVNSYSGGTTLSGNGILKVGNAAALGTGPLTISGGELIGTATEALSNQLTLSGIDTIVAAPGTTLTLNTGAAWTVNSEIAFGRYSTDGVVVWDSPSGSGGSTDRGAIIIAGGTLRAGDSHFQTFLNLPADLTSPFTTLIKAGAALDVAGFASTIYDLRGTGTIENSGAATTVTIADESYLTSIFSGSITGAITLDIGGNVTLSGPAANWSAIDVLSNKILELAGPSSAGVTISSNGKLILDSPAQFTGNIGGLQQGSIIELLDSGFNQTSHPQLSYSGNASGGTLTVTVTLPSQQQVSYNFNLLGDYTANEFSFVGTGSSGSIAVKFTPSSLLAPAVHADSFDFSSTTAPHITTDAGIAHSGHPANDVGFAHDVTEALHAHGPLLDHFADGFFMHGHAFAEALA